MVEIKPFRATVINPEIGNRESLVCPVYDSIRDDEYERYARERDNVIHFTTRRSNESMDDFLHRAEAKLSDLFRRKILVERERDAIYIYGIRYKISHELLMQLDEKDRRGLYFLFGLVCLVDVNDSIFEHEDTFEENTLERYELMKRCMMNFSPIVAEYVMPDHSINNLFQDYLGFKRPDLKLEVNPIVDITFGGERHLLWEIQDESMIEKISGLIQGKQLMILDGHHRFRASKLMSERDGIRYTMMMLVESGDRALLLLPWHRCIRCDIKALWRMVGEYFHARRCENLQRLLVEVNRDDQNVKVGMYDGDFWILEGKEDKVEKISVDKGCIGIDFTALHEWLISPLVSTPEEIAFAPSPEDAVRIVQRGAMNVAFITRTPRKWEVERRVYDERRKLPQKSTRFLPKVIEGVVMRRIHESCGAQART